MTSRPSVSAIQSGLLKLTLYALVAAAVLDPADMVFHAKVPLFVISWLLFLSGLLTKRWNDSIPAPVLLYVAFFSFALPVTSIALYLVSGGGLANFDGFGYWKSFLFLTLTVILSVAEDINLIPALSTVLSVLSVLVIAVSTALAASPALGLGIEAVGTKYQILALSQRSYGSFNYTGIYFPASPLLVIPLGYFAHRFVTSSGRSRLYSALLLLLNVSGMFRSGTRNNVIFSILTPLIVFGWYSRTRALVLSTAVFAIGFFLLANVSTVSAALDVAESSNQVKVQHLEDYAEILQNPKTLILGQGMGSQFFSHGFEDYTSITELTYLELIRSFGLILGGIVIALLMAPLQSLWSREAHGIHFLLLSYAAYLFLCTVNPFLVSSSGMLVLSIVLASVYRLERGGLHSTTRFGTVGPALTY